MVEDNLGRTIATYNEIALEYERKSFGLDPALDLPRFTGLIPPGGYILDAGCGYGRELQYFCANGFRAFGIDLSDSMLDLTRRRMLPAEVAKMDVRQLEIPDETFDGVWCRGVLHHLDRDQILRALSELRRVLKPEGVLFAMCREGEGQITRGEDLTNGLERTFTQLTLSELARLVKNAGFNLVEAYRYNERERYGEGREDSSFVVVIGRKLSGKI